MKNFINKLQNSNETTKKLWLFILSGVSMMIVISFWVLYMDKTVANVSGLNNSPSIAKSDSAVVQDTDKTDKYETPGFFAIFSAGVKTIFDIVKDKLAIRNNIVIENPERNFVAQEVEPVPATELP